MNQKLVSLIIAAACAGPLAGITIQDVNTPGYVTGNSSFTGVAQIIFNESGGTFICSGALIAPTYLLTAGHCVDGASNWSITFQTAGGNTTVGASNTYLEPLFAPYPGNSALAALDQYDIAVIQLNQPAPSDATVYGISTDFAGITFGVTPIDIVGYGLGGNPATGVLGAGTRRAAQQVIQYTANSVEGVPTPDHPIIMTMSFSSATPGGFGLSNGGDSGGPALFGNDIIGIADFGNLPRSDTYLSNTTYLTGHESLADPSISAFVGQFIVPEPGTNALSAAALMTLAGLRRRIRMDSKCKATQKS